MRELLRAAFVIGRRDYRATVLSKTFLFFLLGPLFPVALGVMFGGVGSQIAQEDNERRLAVIADEPEFNALVTARERLAPLGNDFVTLVRIAPGLDPDAQRAELLDRTDKPYTGVLEGGLDAPVLTGSGAATYAIRGQLEAFIDLARRDALIGEPPTGPPLAVNAIGTSASSIANTRTLTARAGQLLLFFLTILLAGMLLSQMLEEKGNKAIEVLASAVPVDAIFIGKLFAMLAISLTGIMVWIGTAVLAFLIFASDGLAAVPPAPAVGWPAFLGFCLVYFTMSYLLIGGAFLGIGAQAGTVREVQTLSMPVTMIQVLIFFAAQLGVGDPYGREAIATAIFPLTSPFAMIARAAEVETLWPHLVAIVWQALWIAIILKFASRLFRKSVLKSGKPLRWPWTRRAAA